MAIADLNVPAVETLQNLTRLVKARATRVYLAEVKDSLQALADLLGGESLAELTTTDKTSLVAAINELVTTIAAAQADATTGIADAATAQAAADAAQADATQGIADAATALGTAQDVGQRADNQVANSGQIADGTTDGKLKTAVDVDTRIWGQLRTKAATDDLWDLTTKIDTIAAKYRAYWLYLDSNGAASVVTADESGASDAASEAAAIAALPAWDTTKCVVGCYVAGPLTDFNGVAGLTAQGTVINGWPSAVV